MPRPGPHLLGRDGIVENGLKIAERPRAIARIEPGQSPLLEGERAERRAVRRQHLQRRHSFGGIETRAEQHDPLKCRELPIEVRNIPVAGQTRKRRRGGLVFSRLDPASRLGEPGQHRRDRQFGRDLGQRAGALDRIGLEKRGAHRVSGGLGGRLGARLAPFIGRGPADDQDKHGADQPAPPPQDTEEPVAAHFLADFVNEGIALVHAGSPKGQGRGIASARYGAKSDCHGTRRTIASAPDASMYCDGILILCAVSGRGAERNVPSRPMAPIDRRDLEWVMRVFPILTAIVVGVFLYVFVMERDTLRAIAGAEAADETVVETEAETASAVAVVAMRSEAREVESGIVLRGRTEANRRVEVRAQTTGLVISEPLRRGALVAEGDVLCELDPGNRPALLAEAEARLAEAEANNTASERLAERGYTAETTAIANRAALQSAQAAIDQARREIERLRIAAPFEGLLETDAAELGSLLQPGSECAAIIDLDPIKLVGFAPERSVEQIQPDATVGARLLNGKEFAGRVTFVSRSADPETRTFRVEAEVPNPDLAIRDGVTAEILVSLAGSSAHLLPQSALTLDDAGRLGVRVVESGAAMFMPVAVVRDTAEGVWVSGLPESADVIVVGQDFVTDGQPVSVTLREARP